MPLALGKGNTKKNSAYQPMKMTVAMMKGKKTWSHLPVVF
jgi:hypothetical protein